MKESNQNSCKEFDYFVYFKLYFDYQIYKHSIL